MFSCSFPQFLPVSVSALRGSTPLTVTFLRFKDDSSVTRGLRGFPKMYLNPSGWAESQQPEYRVTSS